MQRLFFLSYIILLFFGSSAFGQADTLLGNSDEVVVTATRTERKLSNVAVPVLMIQKKEIAATQLRRLSEILQEQTGIFVTNGSGSGSFGGGIFGNGAQLQGMSPEYTLILVNGEPIVGRQGGTINLARLTLSGIKKIEVIKGPGSSLYGSEAMGGVINIITELPYDNGGSVNLKAGGYGLLDATVTGDLVGKHTKLTTSYNHFRMGAIDYDATSFGNQQDPFNSHTLQANLSHQFSQKTRLLAYGRFFSERANNEYEVADENIQMIRVFGNTQITDANLNISLQHNINEHVSTTFRMYGTQYESNQLLFEQKNGEAYYDDRFRQNFIRAENQTDFNLPQNNRLTAGGGFIYEHLNTNRYEGSRSNTIAYAFLQNEWKPAENINIIGGLRYDRNQAYASRFSPKLAVRYSPTDKLKLTASYGAGFKAPDFRQLYLSFINNASGGYALFGANEISQDKLETFRQQGFIQTILPRAANLDLLRPETSHGLNAGASYTFNKKWQGEINLFNNDIADQIIFDVVALRPNGSQVFSYFNVNRSFTRGGEINIKHQLSNSLQLSGGYQLLFTGDKDVLDEIKAGRMFGRRPGSEQVYVMQRSDYMGLPGRSKHMANVKLFYEQPQGGWFGSIRAVYRSAWGTFDRDGNGVINRTDETAKGFVLLNANFGKQINKKLRIMGGMENILNHRDAFNLPNIVGINAYGSISYQF